MSKTNIRLYFKNLCKEQKKRRQKRKKEELQRSQERKEQFEALVQNVRQRVAAGEDLKQWETNKLAELFANDIYVASICPFRNVPVGDDQGTVWEDGHGMKASGKPDYVGGLTARKFNTKIGEGETPAHWDWPKEHCFTRKNHQKWNIWHLPTRWL